MIRLLTPLVVCTVLAVSALAVARLILLPEQWLSSVVALAFLPLAIAFVIVRYRPDAGKNEVLKIPGRVRAAFVGAGVALAAALLISLTDAMGWTQSEGGDWRSLAAMIPVILAVALDLLSARLERKAEKESDE